MIYSADFFLSAVSAGIGQRRYESQQRSESEGGRVRFGSHPSSYGRTHKLVDGTICKPHEKGRALPKFKQKYLKANYLKLY